MRPEYFVAERHIPTICHGYIEYEVTIRISRRKNNGLSKLFVFIVNQSIARLPIPNNKFRRKKLTQKLLPSDNSPLQ